MTFHSFRQGVGQCYQLTDFIAAGSELQLRQLRSVCVASETKHTASSDPGAKTETQSGKTEASESGREVKVTAVVG